MEPSDPVVIGVVLAPHGLRGTLRVRATGSGRHLREGVEPLVADRRRRISRVRRTPKGFLVDLEGVEDRAGAAACTGEDLVLDRSELDAPEEGEFYVGDLLGLDVYDAAGTRVGSVADLFETPAHEVLVVQDEESGRTYVPFTFEHVASVDPKRGRIVVTLSEDLSE